MNHEQLARIRPLIQHLGVPEHVAEALTKPHPVGYALRAMQEDMLRAVAFCPSPALGPSWEQRLFSAMAKAAGATDGPCRNMAKCMEVSAFVCVAQTGIPREESTQTEKPTC